MPKYIVTAAALRLRAGPGTTEKTVGYLSKNSIVQSDQEQGTWLHVLSSDGKSGWSSAKYLQRIDDPAPPPTTSASLGNFMVKIRLLHIRQGPGKTYASIGALSQGEVVEGFAQSLDGQWTQIKKNNGPMGWSSTKYLSKMLGSAERTVTESEMIVIPDKLNLRAAASAEASIVGTAHRGDVLKIVNASPDWAWMQTGGLAGGWAASKYLIEREMLSVTPHDLAALGRHRVATYLVTVRENPRPDARSLGTYNYNHVVEVDSISEDRLWKHCTDAHGLSGWCSFEFLASLNDLGTPRAQEEFPWLPFAFDEYGTAEIPGAGSNPKILGYLASTELFKYPFLPDETDWCAAFVNWCIERAGVRSANSALAFPWARWGKPLQTPRRGCVVAFQWNTGRHHVSFFLGELSNYVVALGGNQEDAVWISIFHKRYVLGYRIPEDWPVDVQPA
ncbi:MAG TPA: TIGR02594 family protein [Anaerolineales bacterium]|jgi:uncharacterized protein (TIGR02594 family)